MRDSKRFRFIKAQSWISARIIVSSIEPWIFDSPIVQIPRRSSTNHGLSTRGGKEEDDEDEASKERIASQSLTS